jgi:predicted 3-demethylubiquinone-9 3-methyltransferase (glyoxalase superfamily)
MQKITPFLWFDGQAEEAMNFYVGIFPDSQVGRVSRYGESGPGPAGSVMAADFTLNGQDFIALNGGPQFKFNESVSFVVSCEGQAEVDHYWDQLSAGGQASACGWLKDRFGLSWQVTPTILPKLLMDPDKGRAQRAMQAMMKQSKIVIAELEAAADAG